MNTTDIFGFCIKKAPFATMYKYFADVDRAVGGGILSHMLGDHDYILMRIWHHVCNLDKPNSWPSVTMNQLADKIGATRVPDENDRLIEPKIKLRGSNG